VRVDRLDLAIVLALAIACVAIYAQTASFGFVGYDDEAHVTLNAVTQQGLAAKAIGPALRATVAANWHPLTQLSHMLDVELFGLEPGGHHATNVLLHLLVTALVFLVVRKATGARWRSAVVAALFAVHPLHVEVVAWVSQRKTLLCAVFGLASTLAYLSYARSGSRSRYVLAAGLLTLGLLAKSMLVTLPLLFALLDSWPLGRARSLPEARGLVREKLVLLFPAVLIGIVTLVAQQSSDAMAPLSLDRLLRVHLPNVLLGYAWYLEKAIWPSGLAAHYPHPYLPLAGGSAPSSLAVVGAGAMLAALVALGAVTRRSRPWIGFGLAWAAIALLPVIGIIQVGTQAVADRYAYLSLIGPFIALTWEAHRLLERLRAPTAVAAAVALALLGTLAFAAHRQAGYWQSSTSLYARGLEISPRDVTLLFNMGNAELAAERYGEAEAHYRRALEVHPGNSPAQLNLAELLRKHGEPADLVEAIALYRSVLADRPGNFRATRGLRKAIAVGEQREARR
jgi:tetratricopeptide (TPR) repeat protein